MTAGVPDRLTQALNRSYRLERELGQGGMATVYLAEDLKHKRRVALKVLKPELAAVLGAERFVQEIKTTANLQHPHILPLFDSGTADSFLYYVMPYIEGETLRGKLDRDTQLGIEEAVRITVEVADALEYAHQHGVIHRDIKPENILLQHGRPMVADFGIALALSAAAGGRMTETGLSLGTPHYMSPEQATAEKDLTARADIYSLASVLYEMLTGEPPHMGTSAQQIIMKIITEPAATVTRLRKSVPPNVAAAVGKALEKLPADRFESAKAFAAALTTASFTVPGTAAAMAVAAGPFNRRRALQWALGAGVGAIATALAFLLLGKGAPAEPIIRFQLTLPASQRLDLQSDEDAPFAISPDGTRIVYAGIDSGNVSNRRLYIRTLDQLDGVPLQGTEDAIAPFFSHDGLWIGFTTEADEKLMKVPVTGGPPITLADDVVQAFASGAWGDDGNIIYTNDDYVLARVPGTGGVSEPLFDPDSIGNGVMFWPSVLPGGQAVLYEQCGGNCERSDLMVLDLATRTRTVVIPGAGRGWYINSGHLVYATANGALYTVPFDPESRTVTGSPVPVLDQVAAGSAGGSRLAISQAGAMIYLSGESAVGLQLVAFDRAGKETVLRTQEGPLSHPRWSPTRDRVALTISGEGADQIWIYDVGSGTLTQLTREGSNYRPSWSPDGRMVAFFSTRGDAADLYWRPADGSGPAERVAEGEDILNGGTTFWTNDGNWILFDGVPEPSQNQEDIYAVGTGADRTRKAVVVTDTQEETGAVSPDGKWVAYGSGESGQWQVYIRPFLAPGGRWLISPGAAGVPLWASNSELVYLDYTADALMSARLEFSPSVRVAERTVLKSWDSYLTGSQSSPEYDVSRDGQHFLALRQPRSNQAVEPIVVLNWFEDIRRRIAAQGSRQP